MLLNKRGDDMKLLQWRRKGRIIACLIVLSMLITSTGMNNIVRAIDSSLVPTKVSYEKEKANIEFEIDKVDKEKYEIESIVSKKDGSIVYEKSEGSEGVKEPVVYEARENGTYEFTIKYTEREDKDSETLEETVGTETLEEAVGTEELTLKDNLIENSDNVKVFINQLKDVKKNNIERAINTASNKDTRAEEDLVDLEEAYLISGRKIYYDYKGDALPIDDTFINIASNQLMLGKKHDNAGYSVQTVGVTNKNAIDYNRNFTLRGEAFVSWAPDGFAIAFHNEEGYEVQNVGGSLGMYKDVSDNESARNPGVPNAIVFEVDTFNNPRPRYNDTDRGSGDDRIKKIAMNITDSEGVVRSEPAVNNNVIDMNDLFEKWANFSVEWNAIENKATFNIGNNTIVYQSEAAGNKLKASPGYYTITSGVNFNYSYAVPNGIRVSSFDYTDYNPFISTKMMVKDSEKSYAIPNETVTIRSEIKNLKQSLIEIDGVLNLYDLLLDGQGENLKISEVRMGKDINNLQKYEGTFDYDNSLPIKFPAQSENYYVEYDVSVPNLQNYGKTNKLNCRVRLGEKGMSQIEDVADIEIRNNPSLVSKITGNPKEKYDVIHLEDENIDTLQNKLWQDIFAKTAVGTEEKIVKESNGESVNVEGEYSIDFIPQSQFPISINRKNTYGIRITVKDKNDDRLTNSFIRYVGISNYMVSNNEKFLFADSLPEILETKLNLYKEDDFQPYMIESAKARAFSVEENGIASAENIKVNKEGWINSKGYADKNVGEYNVNMGIESDFDNVNLNIIQKVLPNTWSYRKRNTTDIDETYVNGSYGYIIIPSHINLKKNGEKIAADDKVEFVGYNTDKTYLVTAIKNFEMTNAQDGSKLQIEIRAEGSTDGTNENIGTIGNGVKLPFRLEALNKKNIGEGFWKGSITFKFKQQ